jgi:hypothetical protein
MKSVTTALCLTVISLTSVFWLIRLIVSCSVLLHPCYYEVMHVLHLLCPRISYTYVSVLHLCIVSFIIVCLIVPAM